MKFILPKYIKTLFLIQMEETTGTIRVMKALDREARAKHILVSIILFLLLLIYDDSLKNITMIIILY